MNERKISLLENITVARGATPNEQEIAQRKIAQYAAQMRSHRTAKPTQVYVYDQMPLEEQSFRVRWEIVKRENRKKWKVD